MHAVSPLLWQEMIRWQNTQSGRRSRAVSHASTHNRTYLLLVIELATYQCILIKSCHVPTLITAITVLASILMLFQRRVLPLRIVEVAEFEALLKDAMYRVGDVGPAGF